MPVANDLDQSYATLCSNDAVMHMHSGNTAAAERAYLKALALDPTDSSGLFNMVQLLHQLQDSRESSYRQRLARVEQKDPLQQYLEALDFERARDYPHAIEHLQRAIQLKRDEDRFYAALARVYESAGDTTRASSALARAQSLSEGRNKAMYRTARDRITNSSYGVKQD